MSFPKFGETISISDSSDIEEIQIIQPNSQKNFNGEINKNVPALPPPKKLLEDQARRIAQAETGIGFSGNGPPIKLSKKKFKNISELPKPTIPIPPFYNQQYEGLTIKFPYQTPHLSQSLIMSNEALAIKTHKNALLESPTGTGKSLALLSTALASQEADPSIHQIIYTSRTHSQLQQLIGEYKKLPYFPQMGILASRKHLCIHPIVSKSADVNSECRKLLINSECPYDKKIKGIPNCFLPNGNFPKFDIEDLKSYGREAGVCPYNLSKPFADESNIIFCPYNYIIKPDQNSAFLNPQNILIIDEGHNIENVCRDEFTFSLYFFEAFLAGNDAVLLQPQLPQFSVVLQVVRKLTFYFLNFLHTKRAAYEHFSDKPNYICDDLNTLLNQWGVEPQQFQAIGITLQQFITTSKSDPKQFKNLQNVLQIEHVLSFCEKVSPIISEMSLQRLNDFKVVYVPGPKLDNDQIKFLCLRPGLLFRPLAKSFSSIIISSGTLSPMGQFSSELETSFEIQCSAPHVVDESQVLTITISKIKNVSISSKYSEMQANERQIFEALGTFFNETLKFVPGGALCFMPSYTAKKNMLDQWKINGIYNEISNKKIIIEEQSNKTAKKIISQFNKSQNGGFLIGVSRGKISEGLDFADDKSRIVYAFGIPFPGIKEPEIELKMKYNDQRRSNNSNICFSGSDWYKVQGFRALFQSIGRCIRHQRDYGAIVLLDNRIDYNIEKFPLWIRKNLYMNFDLKRSCDLLCAFYNEMFRRFPDNIRPPIYSNLSYFDLMKQKANVKENHQNSYGASYQFRSSNFNRTNSAACNDTWSANKFNRNLSEPSAMSQFNYSSNAPQQMNNMQNQFNNSNGNAPQRQQMNNSSQNGNAPQRQQMNNNPNEQNQLNNGNAPHVNAYGGDAPPPQACASSSASELLFTTLYCTSCNCPILRMDHIEEVQFAQFPGKVFGDPQNSSTLSMSIKSANQKEDFLDKEESQWDEEEGFAYRRALCRCGRVVGVDIVAASEMAKAEKGAHVYMVEALAMKCDEQYVSLVNIANCL
ncbi:putative helicase [Histomonas meleagridis]|uniref:putative helicase n=1 Tax=Histomonas meleagridis TaxID=135588 RepID=UPI00355A199F|nr:putative helicase [Histomonas meleagridis]KAH0804181.1 putative helicase [Histomonas meleagridis]